MRAIGGVASLGRDWRISRSRLVRLVKHDIGEFFTIPLAEDVMSAWLADLGWKPKLSPPGLLAKQIYTQLEGHLFALHNETLLGLLEHMNGGMVNRDCSPVTDNAVTPELERDLAIGEVKNRLTSGRSHVYDYLLSKGVFRLGNRIQCPHCMRKSWFSLQGIQESLTCPKCLRAFPALENLTSGIWSYKTTGPFSVPDYAEGAYAVLLTVEFFNDRQNEHDAYDAPFELHCRSSWQREPRSRLRFALGGVGLWRVEGWRAFLRVQDVRTVRGKGF